MTETIPSDRYPMPQGSVRGSRITAIVLTIGVILLGLAVAWLAYNKFEAKDIKSEVLQYSIVDDSTIALSFTVTREEPSEAAVCIVRSRSRDGSETGRREVVVQPSEHGTVQIDTQITTTQPPAIADIYGCGSTIPAYLTVD
ncbi:DUF4307 domain-containing protein [Rhodococcus sp. Q]|uniref:DUF4307 domain-containing protein n=1 Tax=Rhodococcus sp. Q TaxID=2502252 RepID=UPI0010F620B0|nr:DUF4307 domain-containing protein [Rhodococcus sp. Q]